MTTSTLNPPTTLSLPSYLLSKMYSRLDGALHEIEYTNTKFLITKYKFFYDSNNSLDRIIMYSDKGGIYATVYYNVGNFEILLLRHDAPVLHNNNNIIPHDITPFPKDGYTNELKIPKPYKTLIPIIHQIAVKLQYDK